MLRLLLIKYGMWQYFHYEESCEHFPPVPHKITVKHIYYIYKLMFEVIILDHSYMTVKSVNITRAKWSDSTALSRVSRLY